MLHKLLPDEYVEYVGLGAEIAVSLALPIVAGYMLDSYFLTSPWLTIGGVIIGMISFGLLIARVEHKLSKKDNNDKK